MEIKEKQMYTTLEENDYLKENIINEREVELMAISKKNKIKKKQVFTSPIKGMKSYFKHKQDKQENKLRNYQQIECILKKCNSRFENLKKSYDSESEHATGEKEKDEIYQKYLSDRENIRCSLQQMLNTIEQGGEIEICENFMEESTFEFEDDVSNSCRQFDQGNKDLDCNILKEEKKSSGGNETCFMDEAFLLDSDESMTDKDFPHGSLSGGGLRENLLAFENPGLLCYANSVVGMLQYSPLYSLWKNKENNVMANILKEYLLEKRPSNLKEFILDVNGAMQSRGLDEFRIDRQEDAGELLIRILEFLGEDNLLECNRRYECTECLYTSNKNVTKESFIRLDPKEFCGNIEQTIKNMQLFKTFPWQNCPTCLANGREKGYTSMGKVCTKFNNSPDILLLNVFRTMDYAREDSEGVKNMQNLQFQDVLNLQLCEQNEEYFFCGVITHRGESMSGGHYVFTTIGHTSKFIEIDDNKLKFLDDFDKISGEHTVYIYAKRKQYEEFIDQIKTLCVNTSDTVNSELDMPKHQGEHGNKYNDSDMRGDQGVLENEGPEFEEASCFYFGKQNQWWVCNSRGEMKSEDYNKKCRSYTIQLNDKHLVFHMMKNVSLALLSRFTVQEINKIRTKIQMKISHNGLEIDPSSQILNFEDSSTFILYGENLPQNVNISPPIISKWIPKFGTVPFSFNPCFFMPVKEKDDKKSIGGILPTDISLKIRNLIHSASLPTVQKLLTYCGPDVEKKKRYEIFKKSFTTDILEHAINWIEEESGQRITRQDYYMGRSKTEYELLDEFNCLAEQRGQFLTAMKLTNERKEISSKHIKERVAGDWGNMKEPKFLQIHEQNNRLSIAFRGKTIQINPNLTNWVDNNYIEMWGTYEKNNGENLIAKILFYEASIQRPNIEEARDWLENHAMVQCTVFAQMELWFYEDSDKKIVKQICQLFFNTPFQKYQLDCLLATINGSNLAFFQKMPHLKGIPDILKKKSTENDSNNVAIRKAMFQKMSSQYDLSFEDPPSSPDSSPPLDESLLDQRLLETDSLTKCINCDEDFGTNFEMKIHIQNSGECQQKYLLDLGFTEDEIIAVLNQCSYPGCKEEFDYLAHHLNRSKDCQLYYFNMMTVDSIQEVQEALVIQKRQFKAKYIKYKENSKKVKDNRFKLFCQSCNNSFTKIKKHIEESEKCQQDFKNKFNIENVESARFLMLTYYDKCANKACKVEHIHNIRKHLLEDKYIECQNYYMKKLGKKSLEDVFTKVFKLKKSCYMKLYYSNRSPSPSSRKRIDSNSRKRSISQKRTVSNNDRDALDEKEEKYDVKTMEKEAESAAEVWVDMLQHKQCIKCEQVVSSMKKHLQENSNCLNEYKMWTDSNDIFSICNYQYECGNLRCDEKIGKLRDHLEESPEAGCTVFYQAYTGMDTVEDIIKWTRKERRRVKNSVFKCAMTKFYENLEIKKEIATQQSTTPKNKKEEKMKQNPKKSLSPVTPKKKVTPEKEKYVVCKGCDQNLASSQLCEHIIYDSNSCIDAYDSLWQQGEELYKLILLKICNNPECKDKGKTQRDNSLQNHILGNDTCKKWYGNHFQTVDPREIKQHIVQITKITKSKLKSMAGARDYDKQYKLRRHIKMQGWNNTFLTGMKSNLKYKCCICMRNFHETEIHKIVPENTDSAIAELRYHGLQSECIRSRSVLFCPECKKHITTYKEQRPRIDDIQMFVQKRFQLLIALKNLNMKEIPLLERNLNEYIEKSEEIIANVNQPLLQFLSRCMLSEQELTLLGTLAYLKRLSTRAKLAFGKHTGKICAEPAPPGIDGRVVFKKKKGFFMPSLKSDRFTMDWELQQRKEILMERNQLGFGCYFFTFTLNNRQEDGFHMVSLLRSVPEHSHINNIEDYNYANFDSLEHMCNELPLEHTASLLMAHYNRKAVLLVENFIKTYFTNYSARLHVEKNEAEEVFNVKLSGYGWDESTNMYNYSLKRFGTVDVMIKEVSDELNIPTVTLNAYKLAGSYNLSVDKAKEIAEKARLIQNNGSFCLPSEYTLQVGTMSQMCDLTSVVDFHEFLVENVKNYPDIPLQNLYTVRIENNELIINSLKEERKQWTLTFPARAFDSLRNILQCEGTDGDLVNLSYYYILSMASLNDGIGLVHERTKDEVHITPYSPQLLEHLYIESKIELSMKHEYIDVGIKSTEQTSRKLDPMESWVISNDHRPIKFHSLSLAKVPSGPLSSRPFRPTQLEDFALPKCGMYQSDDDGSYVELEGPLKDYKNRPDSMKRVTLAEFILYYECEKEGATDDDRRSFAEKDYIEEDINKSIEISAKDSLSTMNHLPSRVFVPLNRILKLSTKGTTVIPIGDINDEENIMFFFYPWKAETEVQENLVSERKKLEAKELLNKILSYNSSDNFYARFSTDFEDELNIDSENLDEVQNIDSENPDEL